MAQGCCESLEKAVRMNRYYIAITGWIALIILILAVVSEVAFVLE